MEEEGNFQGGYYSEQPSDIFLKLTVEVEETLHKFEMETLRRKRLQVDLKTKTKKWIPIAPGIKSVCNELGIAEILGALRAKATVIGRLTKKTDEEVMKDMFQFHRMMIETFSLRADDWELDEELIKMVLDSCVSLVQDIVFSSRGGFTAMNIRSQYSRHETGTLGNEEQQKTIMGVKV